MSLIAWYPLNGDTKDYSGNNFHLTNNGATVDTSGKIGSCYRFNRDQNNCMVYENLNCSNMTQAFTVSAWCKDSSTDNSYSTVVTLGMSAITIDYEAPSSSIRAFIYVGATPIVLSAPYVKNKWTHVTFKLENRKLFLYLNGELKTKTSITGISNIKNIDSVILGKRKELNYPRYLQGYINDVRIYNEALTAKQIKEISQAKICHYTFNENIQPVKNLCKQYPIKQYITNNSTHTGTVFGKDDFGDYFIKQSTSYRLDGLMINSIPIQTGKYYTVSYELWCEKSFNVVYDFNIVCKNISGNDAPRAEEVSLFGTAYDTPKRWKKFAMRSKAKDEAVEPKICDVIAGYQSTNTGMVGTKIYYRNVMVEEKDRETTYVDDNKSIVLKDVSGLNDLNIIENQTHSFPTYEENSFKFSAYSEITTDITLSTNNIGGDSQLTTISWIKPTAIPAENSHGLIYGRGDYQGFGLYFGYHNSSHIAIATYHRLSDGNKKTAHKAIALNEWVQVACVLDNVNSKIKIYVNGEKVSEAVSATGDFIRTKNTFLLGGEHYPWGNGPWAKYEGYIKDFRIYATALSHEDIKLLYQPEINIDKSNVIRCSEINEEKINDNKIGFYKNASITYNEFNEVPNIKSGVHNLRLGNEILPVLIDMDKDGGRWARVFYHNCKGGTVLFSGDNSYAEAKETNKNAPTGVDKYSILSKLEHFRPNTKSAFEFRLRYPTDAGGCNIWKQTSNPTYEAVTGYVPINIHWTFNLWGGLEYNGRSDYTFIDGSVNNSGWYYAIGAASKHGNGIPSSTNISPNGTTANNVELWVRINNYDLFTDNLISNVSISRDGVLTAKEFREI